MRLKPTNTFLREYWKSLNCSDVYKTFGECFRDTGIEFKQEAYVPSVVDAVNVVVYALHNYIKVSSISYQRLFSQLMFNKFRKNISNYYFQKPGEYISIEFLTPFRLCF